MSKLSRRSFAIATGAVIGTGLFGSTATASVSTYNVSGVSVRQYTPSVPNGRPPIIMVHGGGHASWCWERYAPYFTARGWECHALDWYHHGQSQQLQLQHFTQRSIVHVWQEISTVTSSIGRPYVFMGHSMGGMASLFAAQSMDPEALVLITPVVPSQVGAPPIPIPIDFSQPFPLPPFPVSKSMFFSTMSDAEAMLYYPRLQNESARAVYEATRWTISVALNAITMPTMTVAASADTLTPPAAIQGLANLITGCRHVLVQGMGHSDVLLKAEGWQAVAADIEQWLRSVV